MNFDDLINPGVKDAPIALPLKAFYRRELGAERERKRSLHLCQWHFRERGEIVVPLSAVYARSDAFEDRRGRFYTAMAREFSFQGWRLAAPALVQLPRQGRDGRQQSLSPIDKRVGLIRDQNAGVVEYLEATTDIDDPVSRAATDAEKNTARHFGEIRRRVARKLRSLNERAEGAPLHSPDWMREPTGNTGAPTMTAGKLQAIDEMGNIRSALPRFCVDILDREIMNDEFAFLAHESKRARLIAIEDLRFSIDFVAMEFGEFGQREAAMEHMKRRWRQARELWILRPAIDLARRTKKPGDEPGLPHPPE